MRKKRLTETLAVVLAGIMLLSGCGDTTSKTIEQNGEESMTQEAVSQALEEALSEETSTAAQAETKKEQEKEQKKEMTEVPVTRVTVHDPSVVYDNGTYYVFGSHMAWAKTTDLMNWESFTMNINSEYPELFGKEWESYCKTATNPNLNGNLWAPDVIYNEAMQKYCMYMSVNGDD